MLFVSSSKPVQCNMPSFGQQTVFMMSASLLLKSSIRNNLAAEQHMRLQRGSLRRQRCYAECAAQPVTPEDVAEWVQFVKGNGVTAVVSSPRATVARNDRVVQPGCSKRVVCTMHGILAWGARAS